MYESQLASSPNNYDLGLRSHLNQGQHIWLVVLLDFMGSIIQLIQFPFLFQLVHARTQPEHLNQEQKIGLCCGVALQDNEDRKRLLWPEYSAQPLVRTWAVGLLGLHPNPPRVSKKDWFASIRVWVITGLLFTLYNNPSLLLTAYLLTSPL